MDARPQRGIRPLRLPGDENMAPVNTKQPTLHSRHKSTGTLSNMLNHGPLKGAAKRTAFGDVSNTVKGLIPREDAAGVGKPNKLEIVKPLQITKPATLLRPAQRPLNTAPVKLNAPIPRPDQVQAPEASRAPLEDGRSQAPPPPKRTLSRKATIIYKDSDPEYEPKPRPATSHVSKPEPAALVRKTLEPRHHRSQPHLNTAQPALRHTRSKQSLERIADVHANLVPSDPIYEEAHDDQGITSDEAYQTYMHMVEQKQEQDAVHESSVERKNHELPPLPHPEPEEYWEEEEDEYDEQGYTTAHSYSRGDNTTGGATTVLFPKVTAKSRLELEAAAEMVEAARTPEDVEDEAWDPTMVAEYGDEIFAYMRELEIKMLPNANYMENQAEIQWSMRSVLMDWLIQVHHRFGLLPETLFLCVNYIDRFLSCKIVSLGKLQLVGATAIFVAAKYEEINCPTVSEIVYMVDGGYSVDEILKAERFMLSMLQFELGWPGPMSFLRRISKADDYHLETRTLAKYFLEVTIMDERFVGCPPSYVAAGAHCFSRLTLRKGEWTPAHVHYSGYTWQQLRPLVSLMLECCENPQKHHSAVFDKYADRRFRNASIYVQTELARGFVLPSIQLTTFRPSLPSTLPSTEDVAFHVPLETRESFSRKVQLKECA